MGLPVALLRREVADSEETNGRSSAATTDDETPLPEAEHTEAETSSTQEARPSAKAASIISTSVDSESSEGGSSAVTASPLPQSGRGYLARLATLGASLAQLAPVLRERGNAALARQAVIASAKANLTLQRLAGQDEGAEDERVMWQVGSSSWPFLFDVG